MAEPVHQLDPRLRDLLDAPAGRGRLAAPPVARQRRDHELERVGRLTAVADRIRERIDHLDELDNRSRRAVRHDARRRPLNRRTDVQEVDVDPVDGRHELLVAVQPIGDALHVVGFSPVLGERLDVCQRHPHRPVADGLLLRPSRSR
jgi:hypothetical protein